MKRILNLIFLFSILQINISCTYNKNLEYPYNYMEKSKNYVIDELSRKAIFNFYDSSNNIINLTIEWTNSVDEEYSTIGPVKSIKIYKNNNEINISNANNFSHIEDINFTSINLIENIPESYILIMAWGVGESRALANEIELRIQ